MKVEKKREGRKNEGGQKGKETKNWKEKETTGKKKIPRGLRCLTPALPGLSV